MFSFVQTAQESEAASPEAPLIVPTPLAGLNRSSEGDPVEIVENVMRAAHRLRAILNSHLGQFELTDIRYSVLQAIRETASHGCSQKELADRLQQTESSISTLIERMRQSGLLYRLASTVDRRRKVLLLSELGRETLARAEEYHSRRMAALLTCFNDPDRSTLARLLRVWVEELTRLPSDAARAALSAESFEDESTPLSFPGIERQKPAA